jgi:hypothetical protein
MFMAESLGERREGNAGRPQSGGLVRGLFHMLNLLLPPPPAKGCLAMLGCRTRSIEAPSASTAEPVEFDQPAIWFNSAQPVHRI